MEVLMTPRAWARIADCLDGTPKTVLLPGSEAETIPHHVRHLVHIDRVADSRMIAVRAYCRGPGATDTWACRHCGAPNSSNSSGKCRTCGKYQ
ncbi:hypothetical protein [Nocardiopsis rhodophaea]